MSSIYNLILSIFIYFRTRKIRKLSKKMFKIEKTKKKIDSKMLKLLLSNQQLDRRKRK